MGYIVFVEILRLKNQALRMIKSLREIISGIYFFIYDFLFFSLSKQFYLSTHIKLLKAEMEDKIKYIPIRMRVKLFRKKNIFNA